MYERFTDCARRVLVLANEEACRCNHEYIGTEHILLGLVKEGSCEQLFAHFEVDLMRARREVEKIVQRGPNMVTIGKLPQTPRAKKVIEYAIEEARQLNHNYVGTAHLLLGLLREQEGVAAQVLMNLGLKLDEVREAVRNRIVAKALHETVKEPPALLRAFEPLFATTQLPCSEMFLVSVRGRTRSGMFGPFVSRTAAETVVGVLAGRSDVDSAIIAPWSAAAPGLVDPLDMLKALASNIDVAYQDELRKFLDLEISRRNK